MNNRIPTLAADSAPGQWSVGAEENCGSSWPTHCHGAAAMRSASSSRSADDSAGPTMVWPPTVDLINSDDSRASRCERSLSKPPQ